MDDLFSDDEDAPSPVTHRPRRSSSRAALPRHPCALITHSRAQSGMRDMSPPPSSWAKLHVNSTSPNPDTLMSSSFISSLPLPSTLKGPVYAPGHGPDIAKGLVPLPLATPTSMCAMKRHPSNLTLHKRREYGQYKHSEWHYQLEMLPTSNLRFPSGLESMCQTLLHTVMAS